MTLFIKWTYQIYRYSTQIPKTMHSTEQPMNYFLLEWGGGSISRAMMSTMGNLPSICSEISSYSNQNGWDKKTKWQPWCFESAWPREWHYWEVWPCWSGCGLVGGSMSLWTWTLRPSCLEASLLATFRWRCRTLSSSFTMPVWILPYSCLDNGLNL
jgi:hypothetical protein